MAFFSYLSKYLLTYFAKRVVVIYWPLGKEWLYDFIDLIKLVIYILQFIFLID